MVIKARALLLAGESPEGKGWTNAQIMEATRMAPSTLALLRQRCFEVGPLQALERKAQTSPSRRLLEYLVDELQPDTSIVVLVEDNLSSRVGASLFQMFAPTKARRIACRIERHHPPVYGSRLNIAEMEVSALSRTVFTDRVKSVDELRSLCVLGVERRNKAEVTTNWQFMNADARKKLHRLYPSIQY